MNIDNLSNEELLELYELTYREVSEVNEEQQSIRGYGATIYPIMNVIPRTEAKAPPAPVMTVYCPGKNAENAFRSLPDPAEQLAQTTVKAVTEMMGAEMAAIVAQSITTPAVTPDPTPVPLVGPVVPTPTPTPITPTPTPVTPTPTPYVAPSPTSPSPTPTAPSPTPSTPSPSPTVAPQPTPTPSPSPTPPSPTPPYGGGYY